MESLAYVDFKHNLKRLHCETQIKDIIVSKIREIPNYPTLKFDVELTLFVCNLIENATQDRKITKFDKKNFVINVFCDLFTFNDQDKKIIGDQIEFLISNKKIKRVSSYKIFKTYVYDWCKRKIF